ncbi:unnamed protein product [Leuciscus chuanchicus]
MNVAGVLKWGGVHVRDGDRPLFRALYDPLETLDDGVPGQRASREQTQALFQTSEGAREEEKGMGRRKVRYGEREKRVCQEMYSTCSRAGPVTRSAPLVELQWSGNPAINLKR